MRAKLNFPPITKIINESEANKEILSIPAKITLVRGNKNLGKYTFFIKVSFCKKTLDERLNESLKKLNTSIPENKYMAKS